MDDMNVVAIRNEGEHAGENLAYDVIKYDCEAIITGAFNPKTFDIIADACIARYSGTGYAVKKALNLMEKNLLNYIKYTDGSDTCGGTQHTCDGAHHMQEGV
jgi:predicted Fe-Mo cluster-binding NifX family protein